jgi:hypothetical protein
VRLRRKPMTFPTFEKACSLCFRPQGAITEQLQAVMGFASFDCPEILRRYLARYKPHLKLVGKRLPIKEGKWRRGHGNRLTYFLEPLPEQAKVEVEVER